MWAASAAVWVVSHHNEQPQPLIGVQISKFSKPTSSTPVITAKMASGKFFAMYSLPQCDPKKFILKDCYLFPFPPLALDGCTQSTSSAYISYQKWD